MKGKAGFASDLQPGEKPGGRVPLGCGGDRGSIEEMERLKSDPESDGPDRSVTMVSGSPVPVVNYDQRTSPPT